MRKHYGKINTSEILIERMFSKKTIEITGDLSLGRQNLKEKKNKWTAATESFIG